MVRLSKLLAIMGLIAFLIGNAVLISRIPSRKSNELVTGEATRNIGDDMVMNGPLIDRPFYVPTSVRPSRDESWTWVVPSELYIGDTASLEVSCKVSQSIDRQEIVDLGEDDYSAEEKAVGVHVPKTVDEPITVVVGGPFDWHNEVEQTAPKGAPNPLEWRWVFSCTEPGSKQIQLTFPNPDKGWRQHHVNGKPSTSRFGVIPITVLEPWPDRFSKVALACAWFVGPAFSAPWLISLFNGWRRSRTPPHTPDVYG